MKEGKKVDRGREKTFLGKNNFVLYGFRFPKNGEIILILIFLEPLIILD